MSKPAEVKALDLAQFASLESLRSMKVWACEMGAAGVKLSQESVASLAQVWDIGTIVAKELLEPFLSFLVEKAAFVQSGGSVVFSDLLMLDSPLAAPDYLEALHSTGTIMLGVDVFAEMTIALSLKQCEWGRGFALMSVSSVFRYRRVAIAVWSKMSKLALVLELLNRNWRPRPMLDDACNAGDRHCFSIPMLDRSKHYLVSLVEADSIMKKGAGIIMDGMPESYCQVLLMPTGLEKLQALPGFSNMNHSHLSTTLRRSPTRHGGCSRCRAKASPPRTTWRWTTRPAIHSSRCWTTPPPLCRPSCPLHRCAPHPGPVDPLLARAGDRPPGRLLALLGEAAIVGSMSAPDPCLLLQIQTGRPVRGRHHGGRRMDGRVVARRPSLRTRRRTPPLRHRTMWCQHACTRHDREQPRTRLAQQIRFESVVMRAVTACRGLSAATWDHDLRYHLVHRHFLPGGLWAKESMRRGGESDIHMKQIEFQGMHAPRNDES